MKKISDDPILSYIEDNLEMLWTPEQCADAFGYSSDYFRHLFRTYYDMALGEYLRRRRLVKAAVRVQNGAQVLQTALAYGFETAAGFSKAFKKEFGIPVSELKNQKDILLDSIPTPEYDRNNITVSYMRMPELKLIGQPLLPRKKYGYDLLEEAAYWLDHDIGNMDIEKPDVKSVYRDDIIAMWYHDPENVKITYLLGPTAKNFNHVPEGTVPVTIPSRRYAIFETKREDANEKMAETVRKLCKYVFWEWEPKNAMKKDTMGFTFERYHGKKASLYLPVK